jgi:hypothetical protein
MRRAVVLVGVLLVGACGGDQDGAADTSAAPTANSAGEPIVIRTRMIIAAEERSEPTATGKVLEGSTLGGSPFCVGGTILDSHGSTDPTVSLIDRTITCSDGTVSMELTPSQSGQAQVDSWTIVSGTGTYEELGGNGEIEVVFPPDEGAPVHETFTGSVTR